MQKILNEILYKILMLLIAGNLFSSFKSQNNFEHLKIKDQLINSYLNDMYQDHQLVCTGKGGYFLNNIKKFNLYFDTLGPKSETELRNLLISITENLLNRINSDQKIRQHLNHFPLTHKDLNLMIYLVDKSGNKLKTVMGNLIYYTVSASYQERYLLNS